MHRTAPEQKVSPQKSSSLAPASSSDPVSFLLTTLGCWY